MKNNTQRKIRDVLIVMCSYMALSHSYSAPTANATKIFDAASQSVVTVIVPNGRTIKAQGSGVVIESSASASRIATNAHVVGSAEMVHIRVDGKDYRGEVLTVDDELDIALILVRDSKLPAARIYQDPVQPKPGTAVYAIGSPLGLDRTITSGILSATRKMGGTEWLQFSSPISPGSSGGGLFNEKAELLGITTSKMAAGEGLGFAVKMTDILDFEQADYAAGLLKVFAKMKVAEMVFGLSPDEANLVVTGDRLRSWMRRARDDKGRPLYGEVSKGMSKLKTALSNFSSSGDQKAMADIERSGDVLMNLVRQFLAEQTASHDGGGAGGRIFLACEILSPKGTKDPVDITVDLIAKTANGSSAAISESEVSFKPSETTALKINRFTGELAFQVGDGQIYRGTCASRTKQMF
jgi:hypothetical protein